ncbi:MAG: hypothetical protein WA197_24725 [Candidatus Acidiferrales bacterium]
MRRKQIQSWAAISALTGFLCVGTPALAQSTPDQNSRPENGNEIYHHSVAEFDQFLDSHRETADQLRKEPDLVLNDQFLKSHPELQNYLSQHPTVRDQMRKDPNEFMTAEAAFEQRGDNDANGDRDRDRNGDRRDVASFDRFLDSHRETADQLRKQPDLVLNAEFLKSHPELQEYLQQHPAVRDQIDKDPNAFMAQEENYDQRGDNGANRDRDRRDVASFDRFLDSHRETAQQLRKQPDLVLNAEFLKSHPELQQYLQQHPAVRDQIDKDPNAFMAQEAQFNDRGDQRAAQRGDNGARGDERADNNTHGDRDRDADRDRNGDHRAVANFDQFLDSHRETAEQLRRDPSQINNDEFVKSHPALQAYLQQHPEVRQDVSQNPNAFMQQEARYDRNDNGMDRDTDSRRQFGQFLGGHADVSRQLSENPSLVKDHEYMDNHPELRDYLNSHPDVQQRLTADPDNFVKSAQQFNTTTTTPGTTTKPATTTPGDTTKTPMPDPTKPKQ